MMVSNRILAACAVCSVAVAFVAPTQRSCNLASPRAPPPRAPCPRAPHAAPPRAPRRLAALRAVDSKVVEPIAKVGGVVRLPGSKSLSNRALLIAALCEGETTVENLLASDDTERMLEALDAMGVAVEDLGDSAVRVRPGAAITGRRGCRAERLRAPTT